MSLGGENILNELTVRERDLLKEAWLWRAVQRHAVMHRVNIWLDRDYFPLIAVGGRVYHFPEDEQRFLDDARQRESS